MTYGVLFFTKKEMMGEMKKIRGTGRCVGRINVRVRQKERVKYNRKRTLKKRQKKNKKIWRVGNILEEGSVGEKKER